MPSTSMLTRRTAMATAPAIVAAARSEAAGTTGDQSGWNCFRRRFILPEGRVVDTGNGGISHTEGQGWGMLSAAFHGDHDTFRAIWDWTEANLRRRGDSLHAWRWKPDADPAVADENNATDGDICIAWALARAGRRWDRPDYTGRAAAVARDILRLLVRPAGPWQVLLPGASGFVRSRSLVVNPSYYVFPALRELAGLAPSGAWDRLRADGLDMLAACLDAPYGLPADWTALDTRTGAASPATGHPDRFSYDAIRIPLYLAWDGQRLPALEAGLARFWSLPARPAWVDLGTGTVAGYREPEGFAAVRMLASAPPGARLAPAMPCVEDARDYYSAALVLLARMAWTERPGAA